ncbi:hypothetical protein M9Y10_030182 [Tritrichomonas musculus]|uniref:DUF1963 domain-containing protein n=1 Tax=Tritrichomonas musculus TaxID=1915356 RepID=A0ABR2KP89_9EUKA
MERYKKTCYIPVVKHSDSSNPRVSNFGGVAPYLPINGPIFCDCGDKLQTVFSFHIPSIPDEMKKLFPSDHECVVVGNTCNSCHIHQEVKCYSDEQIDQLVYDDVPSKRNVFNEPRTVTEWKESFMYPYGVNEAGFELPEKDSFNQEELLFIDEFLHEKNYGNKDLKTYLGGYPCFAQGDDRPNGHVLLLEIEESEASTNLWGDCGTAQVWMTTGSDFGSFIMQYNCS